VEGKRKKMESYKLPKEITVTEHILGEGFAAETHFIPTETKVWLMRELLSAGVTSFQVSNFGNARMMPQFRDCEDLYRRLVYPDNVVLNAPVINMRALKRVTELKKSGCGPDNLELTIATTDEFNKMHTGKTTEDSWKMMEPLVGLAHDAGLKVTGGVGGAWTCLASGEKIPSNIPLEFADRWLKLGADHLIHAEGPIGPEPTPKDVYEYFSRMLDKYPDPNLHVFHLHDGFGWGLACYLAAMQAGITQFETCIGGLQGGHGVTIMDHVPVVPSGVRPQADLQVFPRTGVVCTEDFVAMCDAMDVQTGIDINKVCNIGLWVEEIVGRRLWSGYLKSHHFADQ